MHHFLGSAGRSAHPTLETWCPATKEQGLAGSGAPRPTCRRPTNPRVVVPRDEGTRVREERSTTPNLPEAHPPPKTWCPATKEQGFAGSEAPRSTCRRPSAPKDVVPRDGGTRVRGERSTTLNLPEAHPPPKTWCPATKEQGFAGSEAPRPLSRRLHHSGGAPHSPPAEGSSSSVSPPPPPGWRLSKPATASPMGRRPKSPNQWRGHGVESLGGRRPQQAGTPIRPRLAGAHRRRTLPPAIAQPGAGDPPTPRTPPGCNCKAGKSKNQELPAGSSRFLSAFVILIFNPVAVQDSFPS